MALFEGNQKLRDKLKEVGDAVIYGEAYGGKLLKMRKVYGDALRFVVFDVRIGDVWLRVPDAERFALQCGLEFVDYALIPTTEEAINFERDRPSTQAIRNGMGDNHIREGVILRPPMELIRSDGKRIIVKHKRPEFMETQTERKVIDPEQLQVLQDAEAIALEWVTEMRLEHILSKMENPSMTDMATIIKSMVEDVNREAIGEIVTSDAVNKAIGRKTAKITKEYFQKQLHESFEADKTE